MGLAGSRGATQTQESHVNATEFFVLLDGAYPRVPHASNQPKSNFIDLPNEHYDRVDGQRVLEDQLKTFVLLEELGYDGGLVSEQHNGPIGVLGNAMLAGAWLAGQTSKIKIGVTGPIINSYLSPVRLAEEIAAVDIMSRGRLLLGLPVGHGMQHHSIGMMNPVNTRARYREAHDLLVAALTRPGPFEWNGEFYQVPYVNLWPKPLQEPHPSITLFGGGSYETLDLIAKHGYGYNPIGLRGVDSVKKVFNRLHELCEGYGYTADRSQFWGNVSIHVAETDAEARREFEAHELWTQQNFYHSQLHDSFPPGYLSESALRGLYAGESYRSKPISENTYDELLERGALIAGSPETVTERLSEYIDELSIGRMILGFNTGSKPRWMINKALTIFAEDVLPKLRKGNPPAEPKLHGYGSLAEYGVMKDRSRPNPSAYINGEKYDVSTYHVEELRQPIE